MPTYVAINSTSEYDASLSTLRQQTAMKTVSSHVPIATTPQVMCSDSAVPGANVASSHSTPAISPIAANIDSNARPMDRAAMVAITSESAAATNHTPLQRRPTPAAMAKRATEARDAGRLSAAARLPN